MADYDLDPETGGGLLGGSGGGWLGNLFNFGGGRSTTADLYGDLFSKKQLAAIQQRESQAKFKGLLDVLSQAAAPSTFKKNYGQILGQVGAAMMGAEGGDKAATTALGGQLTAQKIAQLKQEADLKRRFLEEQGPLADLIAGVMGGTPGAPAPAPAPPPGSPTSPPPGPTPGAPPPNPAGAPVNPFAPPPIPYAGPGGAPAPRPFGMGAPGAGSAGPLPPTPPSGPDPGAGAGMPPVDPASQYAMMMGGGLLGAGGGGAQPPPTEGDDSLPPQDTVIPSGPGGLLNPDMVKLAALGGGSGGGRDPLDIIAQYESRGRNIMQQVVPPGGGYNPSVGRVTGPSTAQGPWQITNTTWKGAAPKVGIDPEQFPNAMSVPVEDQRRVAQQLYNERGYADWAPYNRALAREVGWKGAQYTEGSGGGSGGGSGPGGGMPSGGLNSDKLQTLMLELARRNASAEVLGMGTPYGSLLGVLQGSPAYKAAIETATRGAGLPFIPKETTARKEAEEPFEQRAKVLDLMIDMRKNGIIYNPQDGSMHSDPQYDAITGRRAEDTEALKLKYQKQIKDYEEKIGIAKEGREQKPATIVGPEGRMIDTAMPQTEIDRRRREQSMRPGQYRPGDIVDKPTAPLSADMEYRVTPQGTFEPAPIANTPAARAAADVAKKDQLQQQYKQLASDTVVARADRIEHLMQNGMLPTTGLGGSLLARMGVGNANDIATMLTTIESNVAANSINQMRQMSPTGAALGNTSDKDIEIFKTQIANVRQASSEAQFLFELREMKRQYLALVHGPEKAAELMSVKPPPPSDLATGKPAAKPYGPVRRID